MSNKQDVTISIGADARGVEAGIDKTKRKIKSLSDAAQQMAGQLDKSGKAAGAGFDVIGAGATRSAKEIERATRTSARELQRQIAELKAGGKATREYAEALARLRGADVNALAPLLDQLDQARKKTDAAASSFSGFKAMAASAVAGLSVGVFVSEISAITRETARAAAEIERFSALSNTSAQEFQRLAAGANTVGISAEKMADIFKDVQDKVGDFVQTGGGGMADFFERVAPKVGVTAEQFRKLSGKDALQLYVSSLEKANLAHSDMVFFMEAIASDSSLLLPLLKNQGAAWEEVGAKAQAYGAIMDAGLLDSARRFKTETDNLTLANQGLKNELMSGLLPAITSLTASLSDGGVQDGLRKTIGLLDDMASGVVSLGTEFMLGMKHADGFWDALYKYGLTNPFKTPKDRLADLRRELSDAEEDVKKAQWLKSNWAKEQDEQRLRSLKQQIEFNEDLIRLENQRETAARNRALDSQNAWWTKNYKSRAPAQESALSPAFTKPTPKVTTLSAEESAYKSLSKSIAELLTQQNLEIATGEKLTNAQKLRMKVEQDVAKSKRAGLLADLEQIEANEAWLKNSADVERSLEAQQKAREQSLKSARDTLKSMRDEEEALAYAEAANISLAQAKAELAANQAALNYQQAIERQEAPATLAYYEEQLRLTKEIAGATGKSEVREANKKAADQAEKDWERVSQTIGDTLADYIMGGGKDAATYLKRLFSTLVLQPVVQTLVSGVMGTGAAAAAGGGSGILSQLGNSGGGFTNWSNLGGNTGDWLLNQSTKLGLNGMEGLGDAAFKLGDTIKGVDAWLKDVPGMSGGIGSALGYAGAVYSLTQGNYGSAIGQAVGTWLLPGIGTMLGGMVGGLLDGFDNSGTPHYGAGAVYSGGKLQTGADIYNRDTFGMGARGEWNANAQQNASGIAASLGAALDGFAVGFGQKAGYTVATAFADDSSDDGAWGSLRIADALGNVLVDWENSRSSKWAPKEFASGDEGYKQFLDQIAVDAKAPFLAMDIAAWSKSMIQAATDIDSLSAALAQVGTVKTVLDSLGKSLSMFADLSGDAQTTLLNSSGGIDALAQNASAFYQGFYSEQERYENSLKQMQEVLAGFGVSIDPAMGERAKSEFKTAVEAAFSAGNMELAAQLLGINQQFASLADYAQKAGVAVDGVAEILSDVMRGLLDDRKSLEAELLRAQGDQSGYLAAVRAIATAGYAEAEIAAWDYNTALHAQIDALDSAASAAQQAAAAEAQRVAAVTQERYGIEGQILQLQGNTAAMRERELAALDPSNRALQEYVYTLQDAATAAHSATAAAQAAKQGAYANLQAAVDREKAYWQEIASASQTAISSLSSTLNLLTSNAQALYGGVDSAQQWQAAQGMVYIENALAAVRSGADVMGFDGLADAISAARGGIDSGVYTSQFERDRDALVLAGQLSELGETADLQLTTEERALKAAQEQINQLEKTLQYWQEQIDGTHTLIDKTMSVEQAVLALSGTMSGYANAVTAAVAAAQAATKYSYSDHVSSPINEHGSHTGVGDSGYQIIGNTLYFPGGGSHTVNGPNAAELLMETYGLKPGGPGGSLIRTRARGGYTPPGLTLVGEEGPELVNFKAPAMVYTAAQSANLMGGNTTRLERLVEGLTAEVQRLQAIVNEGNKHAQQTAEILDQVTEGGTAMVTESLT
ncbi:MAG: hypothetical protein ITG01_11705 [Comamonas sp.]|nr:hypothetical protein [Comamonas sp.]